MDKRQAGVPAPGEEIWTGAGDTVPEIGGTSAAVVGISEEDAGAAEELKQMGRVITQGRPRRTIAGVGFNRQLPTPARS